MAALGLIYFVFTLFIGVAAVVWRKFFSSSTTTSSNESTETSDGSGNTIENTKILVKVSPSTNGLLESGGNDDILDETFKAVMESGDFFGTHSPVSEESVDNTLVLKDLTGTMSEVNTSTNEDTLQDLQEEILESIFSPPQHQEDNIQCQSSIMIHEELSNKCPPEIHSTSEAETPIIQQIIQDASTKEEIHSKNELESSRIHQEEDKEENKEPSELFLNYLLIVQGIVSGYLERKSLNQTRETLSLISQGLVNSFNIRNELNEEKNNLATFQSLVRNTNSMRKFMDEKQKVQLIQAFMQSKIEYLKRTEEKEQLVELQSILKSKLLVKDLKNLVRSVLTLQSFLHAKSVEESFVNSLTLIQLLQARVRSNIQSKKIGENLQSLEVLQSKCISSLIERDLRKKMEGVVILQSMVRGFIALKQLENNIDNCKIVQSACIASLKQRELVNLKNLTLMINAITNSKQVGLGFRNSMDQVKFVESIIRGHTQRRSVTQSLQSITFSQSIVKGNLTRNSLQEKFGKANTISALSVSKSSRDIFITEKSRVLILQSLARSKLVTGQLRVKQNNEMDLALAIQSLSNSFRIRCTHNEKTRSVNLIKNLLVATEKRKILKQDKTQLQTIQATLRGFMARHLHMDNFNSALLIQSLLTSHKTRDMTVEAINKLTVLQSLTRRVHTQKENSHNLGRALILSAFAKGRLMAHHLGMQSSLVIKMQSFTRQQTSRKQMEKEIHNAILFESLCTGVLERKNLSTVLSNILHCQSLVRGFLTRKTRGSDEQFDTTQKKTHLSSLVQSCVFGREIRLSKERQLAKVTTLQALSKSLLSLYCFKQQEILSLHLQALYHSMVERKVFSKDLDHVNIIEALCRSRSENNTSTSNKNRLLIMQAAVRGYLENRYVTKEKSRVDSLQTLTCAFVQKQFVKRQIVDVTSMQSIIRGNNHGKGMTIFKSQLQLVQACLRGYLKQLNLEELDILSKQCGSLIRGYLSRHSFEKVRQSTIPSIQAASKQYLISKRKIESVENITQIQTLCRRYLNNSKFSESLSEIMSLQALIMKRSKKQHTTLHLNLIPHIQALFRGKQGRNTNINSNDISVIQSVVRSMQQRYLLKQVKQGANILQTSMVGYTTRRNLLNKLADVKSTQNILKTIVHGNGVRCLAKQSLGLISHFQQKCKTRLELETVQKKKKCLLMVQSLGRGYVIRNFIRNTVKPSVDYISSICIGKIERDSCTDTIHKAKLLQSLVRGNQDRSQLSNQRQQLSLLQAAFKSWQVQNKFKKEHEDKIIAELEEKIKSVVIIQGFTRGFLFRRDDLLYTKKRQESPTQQSSELLSTAEILRQLYQNDEFGDNEDSEEEETQINYPEEDQHEPTLTNEPRVGGLQHFTNPPSSPEDTPSIVPIPLHGKLSNAPLPSINITASTPTPTTTASPLVFTKDPISSVPHSRPPSQKPPTRRQIIQNIIEECKRTKNPILDLSGYDLETLPYSAIDCNHVTELRLSQNNLVTLPSWFIDTFNDLKVLDLSGNQLYELPIDLSRLSLTSIDLSANKFEFLPQALNEMNTLTKINISGNVLLSLPSTISHLSNVEVLDISNNYLMTLPDDIKKLKKLKHFEYDNNEYLQSEISKIAEIISSVLGEKSKYIIQKLRNEDNMGYKEISSKQRDNLFLDPFSDFTDMSEATEMYNGEDGESEYSMTEDAMLSPRLLRNNSSATMLETDTTSTPMTPVSGRNNYNLDTPLTNTLSVTTDGYDTPCISPPAMSDSDTEDTITPPKYNPPVMIPQIKLEVIDNFESPSSSPAEQSPISIGPPKLNMSEEDKKVNFGQLNKDGNEKSLNEVVHMEHPLFATSKIRPVSASYKKVATDESEEEQKEREAKENKKSKERINMVLEILESERKYVKYLEVLWDLFYEPIVNNYFPSDKNKNPEESERLVPKAVARGFFPNDLLTIKTFNKNFLAKLEDRFKIYKGDPTKIYDMLIGDLFEKIAPFFKIYTSYLSSYESTMNKIREYRAEDKKFDKWLDKRKTQPRCAGLEIGSFLIMPVQRIPRYKLLLENLCKNTPPDHADYSNLLSAIEKITESATTQNGKIKETNNRIKVYQLSRLMKLSDLVQPHRRLIREGEVVFEDQPKIEFKAYLFNDIIVFREKKRQKTKVAKSVKAYSLIDAYISGGGQNRLSMVLLNAEKNKTVEKEIHFPSHENKMEWVLEIEKALEEVREKRELISKGTKAIVRTSSRAGRFFRALKSPGRKGELSPSSSTLSANIISQPSTPSTSAPELRGVTRTDSTVSTQSNSSVISNLSVISSTSNALSSSSSSIGSEGKKKSILGKIMSLGKKK